MQTSLQPSEGMYRQEKQAQHLFLHGVLPLAKQHNLALVLHCRDDGDRAASEEVPLLLKEKRIESSSNPHALFPLKKIICG